MKFRSNNNKIEDSFCEKVRYNPNTIGNHFMILNGEYNEEKTQCGTLNILSLMTKIYKINGENPKESINELINKSKECIGVNDEL